MLRIATWNACMAVHRKWDALLSLRADVVVVPECARPDLPALAKLASAARSWCWLGDIPSKGIAVMSFGDVTLEPLETVATDPKFALPVRVHGPREFQLLAMWTQAPKKKSRGAIGYTATTCAAIAKHERFLSAAPTVIAGDFNSNAVFDDDVRDESSHAYLVERLRALGTFSAYHAHHGEAHGAETKPSFFLYRHRHRPFHLDYVFLPEAWRERVRGVELGEVDEWIARSDHLPMTVDVDV
jgi:exodeoxyribonuclease-3